MPINNLSVGRDITVNFHSPDGELKFTKHAISFNVRPTAVSGQVEPLDSSPIPYTIPNGFTGTVDFERVGSDLDDFWDSYEDGYYLGVNLLGSTITETITEVGGNQSQYVYTNVFFNVDDLGEWSRNNTVRQRITFMAARRQKVL